MHRSLLLLALAALGLSALTFDSTAQTPAPVIIQAVTPAPAVAPKAPAPAEETKTANTLQLLIEMQTTNAETIKKQEAALATLDELQKAAEEMKIFSKRG